MIDSVLEAVSDIIRKSGSFFDTILGQRFFYMGEVPDNPPPSYPYMTFFAHPTVPKETIFVDPAGEALRPTTVDHTRIQFDIWLDRKTSSAADLTPIGRVFRILMNDANIVHPEFGSGIMIWVSTTPRVDEANDKIVLTIDYMAQVHDTSGVP